MSHTHPTAAQKGTKGGEGRQSRRRPQRPGNQKEPEQQRSDPPPPYKGTDGGIGVAKFKGAKLSIDPKDQGTRNNPNSKGSTHPHPVATPQGNR